VHLNRNIIYAQQKYLKDSYQHAYIEPLVNLENISFSASPNSASSLSLLNPSSNSLIVGIGSLPSEIASSSILRGLIHIVVDKYLVQSAFEIQTFFSEALIEQIVSRLYPGQYLPRAIILNNPLMVRDFEGAFHSRLRDRYNNMPFFHHAIHPVTSFALRRARQINLQSSYFSQGPANHFVLAEGLYQAQLSNTGLSAAVADRIKVLDYRDPLPVDLLHLSGMAALLNIRPDFCQQIQRGSLFPTSFNHRWKPSTKLQASIALGVPLLSMPEASLIYYSNKVGWPVFFFSSLAELEELIYWCTDDTSMIAECKARRLESLVTLQSLYVSEMLHVMNKLS